MTTKQTLRSDIKGDNRMIEQWKIELAWKKGCERFVTAFPDASRVTPTEFAWQAFIKDSEPIADHILYDDEAPGHAYFLMVAEHSKFNEYAREDSDK